jgi:hypothetical protein
MSFSVNFGSAKPSLSLDFANTKALDPRVTFTRASQGRFYDGVTTAKAEENLQLRSQEFETSPWTFERVAVTANSTAAPDGTTTADTLTETATTGNHTTTGGSIVTTANTQYTVSVFIKTNGRTAATVAFASTTPNNYAAATFDLSGVSVTQTNQAGTGWSVVSSSITASTNGFYRCVVTVQTGTTVSSTQVAISLSDSTTFTPDTYGRKSYAGDGTSGVFLWGAQLEQRSAVTAYTATTTQPITNYIPVLLAAQAGVPRFDHNPTTGVSLGLLIEEQRTNLLLRSQQVGGTGWSNGRTITFQNIAVAPDGTVTASKVAGDPAQTGNKRVFALVTTVASTLYTASVYVKAGEIPRVRLAIATAAESVYTGGTADFDLVNGTVLSGTGTIVSVGNGWYRCAVSATATQTDSAVYFYPLNLGPGFVGDGFSGIYIWGAQLEAGAFPTSYIPTVAAQVTRSADAASMTGVSFSSWFRADEGTMYAEAVSVFPSSSAGILNVTATSGAITNSMFSKFHSDQKLRVFVNGSSVVNLGSASETANSFVKFSWVYKAGDYAISRNGAAVITSTNATVPQGLAVLDIGEVGSTKLNGTIKKIAYYPLRLTNAQLQALTTV